MNEIVEQVSTRTAYTNRWMRVREDEVRRPDGSAGIFGVVEKDDFALVVPAERDSFWLVEQYRYPVGGRYWEFPQGALGAGASPTETAHGELAEETGLRARRLDHIGYLYEAYGYSTQGFHVFLATELAPGRPERPAEERDMRVRRFSRAEFVEMVRRGSVRDAPSLAAWGLLRLEEEETT